MCGITGFVHRVRFQESLLASMAQSLSYRGPDAQGVLQEPFNSTHQIGLAHRRLSILDLSAQGNQPMTSPEGRVVVVYNGEIYNFQALRSELEQKGHTFTSHADTEVIIQGYLHGGIDFIERLNGMFAIALYDRSSQSLYLIRDRMGVKPLYYFFKGDTLIFGSELKPLLLHPRFEKSLDYHALSSFLCHGYITAPHTIFQHTHKVMPGSYLHYQKGQIRSVCYWSLTERFQNREVDHKKTEEMWIEALDQRLTTSIQQRMLSDVPLGCFLSGGIDSSLVTAIMQKLSSQPVKTFTIGFEEKAFDEAPEAEAIARHLGTDHHTAYLSRQKAVDLISQIPHFYDEPFADSSQIPTMFLSQVTRQNVTVALSGDGGDEFFCGYERYNTILRLKKFEPYARIARYVPFLKAAVKKYCQNTKYGQFFHLTSDEQIINACHRAALDYFPLIKDYTPHLDRRYEETLMFSDHPQEKHMIQDMLTYLPDDIMTKVDRAAMSASLEARPPLVDDHETIEFSFTIPHTFKYHQGHQKYLLKKLLEQYVPRSLFERPKKGFGIPLQDLLKNDLKERVCDLLSPQAILAQSLFDVRQVESLRQRWLHTDEKGGQQACAMPFLGSIVSRYKLNQDGHFNRVLWHLFVFQLWYETYFSPHVPNKF